MIDHDKYNSVHSLMKANQSLESILTALCALSNLSCLLSHTKRHDRFDNAHSAVKSLSRGLQGAYVETYVGFCEETCRVWMNSLQNGKYVSNYTQLTLASVA